MSHPASTSTIPTPQFAHKAQRARSIALWVLVGASVVVAFAVLVADAALTAEQRTAVFAHTGMFP